MSSSYDSLIFPTCGKGVDDFRDVNLFKRHLLNHEKEENSYICHLCTQKLQTKESLKVHIRVIHNKEKIKCDKCDKVFATAGNLKRHQLSHSDMAISCLYCEKTVSDRKTLEIHIKNAKRSHMTFQTMSALFAIKHIRIRKHY